jgi:DNA replication protein DnaC
MRTDSPTSNRRPIPKSSALPAAGGVARDAAAVDAAADDGEIIGRSHLHSSLGSLVGRFIQIEGYRCLSLMRAVGVVNCQLALVWLALRSCSQAAYLLRLAELELIDRERRMVERRIKAAKFPTVKSLDSFDFAVLPSLNKALVMELARSEYVERRENIIAVGNSGTGKSHIGLGLGLAACQKGLSVGFTTAAALVHELIEARDEKRLLRLQRQLAGYKLLIIDELGYVPLSQTGAELLFEVFSQRYGAPGLRCLA